MYISNVRKGEVKERPYIIFDMNKNLMKKASVYLYNEAEDDKYKYRVYVRAYSNDERLNKDYYSDLVKMIDEIRANYYEVANYFLSLDSVTLFDDITEDDIEYNQDVITIDDGYSIKFICNIESEDDLITYLSANSLDNKPKTLTLENKS